MVEKFIHVTADGRLPAILDVDFHCNFLIKRNHKLPSSVFFRMAGKSQLSKNFKLG